MQWRELPRPESGPRGTQKLPQARLDANRGWRKQCGCSQLTTLQAPCCWKERRGLQPLSSWFLQTCKAPTVSAWPGGSVVPQASQRIQGSAQHTSHPSLLPASFLSQVIGPGWSPDSKRDTLVSPVRESKILRPPPPTQPILDLTEGGKAACSGVRPLMCGIWSCKPAASTG